MRYAVISDVHSNLEALQAVLVHIKKRGIKDIFCLGDTVGYGPNPLECLKIIIENTQVCVKGNHEEALVDSAVFFNSAAKNAIDWQRSVIMNPENQDKEVIDFLQNLPISFSMDGYLFIHASPLDPTSDYIFAKDIRIEKEKIKSIFAAFDSVLFIGHTHVPCVITESMEIYNLQQLGYKYQYKNKKAIINVGSVGQPRDNDPRSSYVEVIDDMFFFHRVSYDNQKTREKIIQSNTLDKSLGERLLTGS